MLQVDARPRSNRKRLVYMLFCVVAFLCGAITLRAETNSANLSGPEKTDHQVKGDTKDAHGKQSAAQVPQLVDLTPSTGINFQHLSSPEQKYIVESMSGGVALLDYDGDGWLDIYFTNAPAFP